MKNFNNEEVRRAVRENYGKIAKSSTVSDACCAAVQTEAARSCCGTESSCGGAEVEARPSPEGVSAKIGYTEEDVASVPEGADMGLGCGNPKAIASLKLGETVLDLGSGGGFDCFLAAKEVGNLGRVIGVDMTPEMISKARENATKAGFANVEFRLGEIEHLPVADDSMDVIISNCFVNLSPEKSKVYGEAFRVLKPGGRLAIADVLVTADLPEEVQNDIALLTGCVSGASNLEELEFILEKAGFSRIRIIPVDESRRFIREWAPGTKIADFVISATIEAVKP